VQVADQNWAVLQAARASIASFAAAVRAAQIAPELRLPVRLYDMGRHYKVVKDKWIGFAGGLKE
jgi:hypothetical protein